MTPRNHLRDPTPPIGIPLKENQHTSGTSHPGYWKSQKVDWETNTRMENNTVGARNTAMANASWSTTV